MDGLDEMTTGAATLVAEVKHDAQGGSVRVYETTPELLGITRVNPLSIAPENLDAATKLFTDVLENCAPRAARDMTLINAAAALLAAGIVDDLRGGVVVAQSVLTTGAARETLANLVRISGESAG